MTTSDVSSDGTVSGEVRVFEDRQIIVFDVRFLPSGNTIAHLGLSKVLFRNGATGAIEHTLHMPEGVRYVMAWALSPSGDRILWACKETGLHLVGLSGLSSSSGATNGDGAHEDLSRRYPAYHTACDVTFSPDGRMCAAAHGQAYATVWNLEGGGLWRLLGREDPRQPPTQIRRVVWAPDGKTVATRDDRGVVRLWDVETGRETLRVVGRSNPSLAEVDRPDDEPLDVWSPAGFGAIAFTPDSRHLAAGDAEVVRLWSVETGREVAAWVGHGARHWGLDYRPRIYAIRFSADGRRALTIGVDSALRVWDVPTGTQIWGAIPAPCCIDHGDISADGRRVIWAGCRGMRLYEVA
ncbi:MAG: WD40 repeat domain-containing protein [Gemmatimonadota bacterium]